jgi:hypothetical protein
MIFIQRIPIEYQLVAALKAGGGHRPRQKSETPRTKLGKALQVLIQSRRDGGSYPRVERSGDSRKAEPWEYRRIDPSPGGAVETALDKGSSNLPSPFQGSLLMAFLHPRVPLCYRFAPPWAMVTSPLRG